MALPKNYLTSTKNLAAILTAMQQAQAPKQFSISFLENLGFKSNADRLVIGVLKAIRFLHPDGRPTTRYFEFLDQTQGARVLAEGIREAYSDLFEVNIGAHKMNRTEVKNKLKTLTQGQNSDDVLSKMANTFTSLAALADFEAVEPADRPSEDQDEAEEERDFVPEEKLALKGLSLGGLVYNIQIQLPESRDPVVYDALFRSLRTHLFS